MWQSVHWVPGDPGAKWERDARPALERPEGGGVWGTNTPNVVALPGGGFRLYYALIGPTAANPHAGNPHNLATTSSGSL